MPSPGGTFLGPWSLLSPRPAIPSSGTLPQEPATHWATPVLLPVLPTPSLPCHNILPGFLLCQCSCQIGWLCWGRGPLVQRGPRGPGAAQIPCLCQRSLGSRHRGSISALQFPTQHSLYLLSHTTPEVSRLPLSLPDPVCECVWEEQLYFNANRQKKKKKTTQWLLGQRLGGPPASLPSSHHLYHPLHHGRGQYCQVLHQERPTSSSLVFRGVSSQLPL